MPPSRGREALGVSAFPPDAASSSRSISDQLLPERLPSPWSGVFLPSAQTVSRVARPGLWFDLASGRTQRLWMSITGSSSGDT